MYTLPSTWLRHIATFLPHSWHSFQESSDILS
jgi:hypothetical protein